jgi:hypothetical protein
LKIPAESSIAVGEPPVFIKRAAIIVILRIVQAGWGRARAVTDVVKPDGFEVPMTHCLREGMLQALFDDRHPWRTKMMIAPGTETFSPCIPHRPSGLSDIAVYLYVYTRLGDHDPQAIIECKRIAGSDAELCRYYVQRGIDRFQTGQYASRHAVGFMVGYLISGNEAAAATGINGYLERENRLADRLCFPGLVEHPGVWRSRHIRSAPSAPIELHHQLLPIVEAE